MTTTNIELFKLAKYFKFTLTSVCFKNELPKQPIMGNYIINLASNFQNNGGTHWCCLIIDNQNNILYFDPFGEPPPEEVIDFIHLFKRNYGYNEVDIQNMNSSYCGYFCIALILLTQKRGNLFDKSNEFINMFSRNTKMNDDILRQYFKPYKKNKIISRLYR